MGKNALNLFKILTKTFIGTFFGAVVERVYIFFLFVSPSVWMSDNWNECQEGSVWQILRLKSHVIGERSYKF